MADFQLLKSLCVPSTKRIFYLVLDGLGGVPVAEHGGLTELEAASTPNMDRLAKLGACGLHDPVSPGIMPGSGPGHFALFGYDPVEYQVGRGVPEALGSGFQLTPKDLAVRGNFCAVKPGPSGGEVVANRRAFRPSTEQCAKLCLILQNEIELPGVELLVRPVKEHRFLLALRGAGLSAEWTETDPQAVDVPIPEARPLSPPAARTVELVSAFCRQARQVLGGEPVVRSGAKPDPEEHYNVLLRGPGKYPSMPTLPEIFGIRAAAIAAYPMYRGVAQLVGMDVLDVPAPQGLQEQVAVVADHAADYDFYFFHVKGTDKAGEDKKFGEKVRVIEEVDSTVVPQIESHGFDVLCITGDHASPAALGSHGWQPVPFLIRGPYTPADPVETFSERSCTSGAYGRILAKEIIVELMSQAGRLMKFGA